MKRIRCRAVRDGSRWRWLVWLDPVDAPPIRHWRDRVNSRVMGLFDSWQEALEAGSRTRAGF